MINDLSVRKTVVVRADQSRAFRVFCEQIGRWWPLDYHIGEQDPVEVVMELVPGGRWFERAADGSECDWGKVIDVHAPDRIVLRWQISPAWKADSAIMSEVEVRFVPEGDDTTRVELEHRNLATFGADAETMRGIFDGEGGWPAILRRYTELVNT
jgi:uncharacterized protein YndB with AHSA1/START domain